MTYLFLLLVFILGISIGGYGESCQDKLANYLRNKYMRTDDSFEDYELFDDEDEYPEWVDCEDENDNLYV